jgi:hypothetical protein
MADQVRVEYDKAQTKQILRAFKAMDDEAVKQSKIIYRDIKGR